VSSPGGLSLFTKKFEMLDRHIAVHEAGHGILGDWWGLTVEYITIEPTPEYAGHVKYWFSWDDEPRIPAVVHLAGFAAEVALLGNSHCKSVSDRAGVRPGEARRAWYDAYQLARKHRGDIQKLADCLQEDRTICWPLISQVVETDGTRRINRTRSDHAA
jgi:hypothetical protein